MFKQLKERWDRRSYAKRLQRYRLQLALIGGKINNLKEMPKLLSELWRQIEVTDLTTFTPKQRIGVVMDLGHPTLESLIEFIEEFNHLMANEQDSALEQLSLDHFNEIKPRVLDHYLSDAKHFDVNTEALLTTLKGQMLSHAHMLDNFDNQYYQRQAQRFYHDLYRLTTQLVETVTGKEIVAIQSPH